MMKANFHGIEVEGTPEEIFDLMCRAGDAGSLRNRKQSDTAQQGLQSNYDHRKYGAGTCQNVANER